MLLKVLLLIALANRAAIALENGLARTPPMGWMSWLRFGCITDCENRPNECISENLFKRIADKLVSDGYLAAGYEYVIIDDCWLEKERDPVTQKLVADRKRFPSGLNALADYIHGKGLKFGLYQDYGTKTCGGYPGVIDHMALDAQTFADWDVDYVKLDGCYNQNTMDEGYPEFGRQLNKTGRPMVYSCSWPAYVPEDKKPSKYESLKKHCNLWRNYGDIGNSYNAVVNIMDYFAKYQDTIQPQAGPGHWNDPDMLVLGNKGLNYDQSKTQMAIWAIMAAPLIMSNDLAVVSSEIRSILINPDVIAVNQDPLGIQGRRVLSKDNTEIWTRPITPISSNGQYSYAVAFVSRRADGEPYSTTFNLKELGLHNQPGYDVVDLFDKNRNTEHVKEQSLFKTRINPNGVNFYKFRAL